MDRSIKVKASLLLAVAVTGTIGVTGIVQADYQPSATDVVGVGAETLNFTMDFLSDGDAQGDLGFNAANNARKLVAFDSTADANARNAYVNGSTFLAPIPLNPTVVLRAGSSPVQRPTTSGSSFSAINADTGAVHKIDFIKSIALPTAAQQTTAANNGWGFLHVVQIGSDPLQIVASNNTNAPAGLTAAQLVGIYQGTTVHWNDIPGNAAGSPDVIIPLITPVGAGTRNTLLADLRAANGGNAIVLGANVRTVEPNDPTDITILNAAEAPNAIMPFAVGRLNLWNTGYFKNPNTPFPGGVALTPGVHALTGTPPGGGAFYSTTIGLYVIFRQSDTVDDPWQPGSTKNWVQTLFSDPTGSPYVSKPAAQALIAASGVTPTYNDLGNVSAG
jgi:ABC-type phosphate transport system substrate-binding protein